MAVSSHARSQRDVHSPATLEACFHRCVDSLERHLDPLGVTADVLDGCKSACAEQDIPVVRLIAQPGREIYRTAVGGVVIPPFEAHHADGRIAERDPDPKAQPVPELAPLTAKLGHPRPHRDGQPHRLAGRVVAGQRVVEDHHDPVAGAVVDPGRMGRDQLAHLLVIGLQHLDRLLGLRLLTERREAADVGEENPDQRPVALQHLL